MSNSKNSRLLKRPIEREYCVVWTAESRRFEIMLGGKATGTFAHDKATAVKLANRIARRDSMHTGLRTIVSSVQDEQRMIDWDGSSAWEN